MPHIVVTLKAYKEDGQWVSECLEFDVASAGDTLDEAFENATDAVIVYLNTLEEKGLREKVFAERHVNVHTEDPEPDGELVTLPRARPGDFVSPTVVPLASVA